MKLTVDRPPGKLSVAVEEIRLALHAGAFSLEAWHEAIALAARIADNPVLVILDDAQSVSDAAVLEVGKVFQDFGLLSEATWLDLQKGLKDEATALDTLALLNAFIRDWQELVVAADAIVLAVQKPLADIGVTAEQFQYQFGKALQDTATAAEDLQRIVQFYRGLQDTLTAVEALGLSVSQLQQDNAIASEALRLNTTGVRNDTAVASGTARLLMQGYVASGDYFADDYTGTSRSFND